MSHGASGSQISRQVLIAALNRLGALLGQEGKQLELVCCGGAVSVLYHQSRQITHDVDAIFPDDPNVTATLKSLIDRVGVELGLEHGEDGRWFNDGISFFGLTTKSDVVIFKHPHLVLKAADWHEMLALKLDAYRSERDISDAVHFLREIGAGQKEEVFRRVFGYNTNRH